ncbi:hypothetical protein D4R78_01525 [bacterium]|nr:MAG: hypothetical protein D4R78_01525 [bacterium]
MRANQGGFTIIEALLCTLFITIIFSALFLTLNIGQLSSPANAAKIELRDNLRRLLDWITRDVRNTSRGEIAANNPSADYIKFRQVQGMDTQTGYYILSSDYIEYAYNSIDQKITRNLLDSSGNVLQSWEFGGITQSPFYTRDSLGALVVLSQGLLLNSGILIVDIRAEKQVCEVRINQNCLNLTLALSGEIKIRNE